MNVFYSFCFSLAVDVILLDLFLLSIFGIIIQKIAIPITSKIPIVAFNSVGMVVLSPTSFLRGTQLCILPSILLWLSFVVYRFFVACCSSLSKSKTLKTYKSYGIANITIYQPILLNDVNTQCCIGNLMAQPKVKEVPKVVAKTVPIKPVAKVEQKKPVVKKV
jgi:hypothetical protein